MAYGLVFLVALVGFPLGFAASSLQRHYHRMLALAAAMALPLLAILAVLIVQGVWEAAAIPIALFYALIVLSPQLLAWMALTALGYRFGRRRASADPHPGGPRKA